MTLRLKYRQKHDWKENKFTKSNKNIGYMES